MLMLDLKQAKSLSRKKRIRRMRPVKSPVMAEKLLRKKTEDLWQYIIMPSLERIKTAISQGAGLEQLSAMMEQELKQAEWLYGAEAGQVIDMWRLAVDRTTRAKMNAALNQSLGIDISTVLDDPMVAEALAVGAFRAEELIKTMPTKIMGQVADAVMRNMRGVPLPEGRSLLDQIDFLGTRSRAWANVIARDQTAKLTATLNQTRQTALGIEEYYWRTMKDTNVVGNPNGNYPDWNKMHSNHYVMEGMLCRYDDVTIYSDDDGRTWKKRLGEMPKENAGFQVMCRCYSEPKIDLDKILTHATVQ
jgi:uncharacterized protein with gpF-like domain